MWEDCWSTSCLFPHQTSTSSREIICQTPGEFFSRFRHPVSLFAGDSFHLKADDIQGLLSELPLGSCLKSHTACSCHLRDTDSEMFTCSAHMCSWCADTKCSFKKWFLISGQAFLLKELFDFRSVWDRLLSFVTQFYFAMLPFQKTDEGFLTSHKDE